MTSPFPIPLNRPLVFFDLETTGLDFKYDRIIEIGAVKIHPDGRQETFHIRLNPGMKISAEVQAITGISNEDVARASSFVHAFPEISRFFEKVDLGVYNAKFDVKMLNEEFKRAGADFKLEERAVLDAQAIFHQKEKRDLAAAYKFYCNRELANAHSAQADVDATYEVFLAQLTRYPDLPREIDALHKYCKSNQERFVDSEGKFFWRDGEAVFNFGKFKSQTLKSVTHSHPEYLHWVIAPERQFSQEVIDICYKAMKGEFPKKNQ